LRTPKRSLDGGKFEEAVPARKRPRTTGGESDCLIISHEQPASDQNGIITDPTPGSLPREHKGKTRTHKQTSRYTFSSSPALSAENPVEDEETRRHKEALHQKFVKKLGRPDSITEIKRRRWQETEETGSNQPDSNEEDTSEEAPSAKPPTKGKKGTSKKKGGGKLTPMEKQYLDIKRNHLDTILVVEVGYKFKFFGEDARIVAKELGIVCIPGKFRYDEHPSEAHLDRFATASVPVHRLHVHVKRLVDAGHKVGVVRQLETAALKAAGDNRNTPFVRKLTNLYTKGTYIDEVEGLEVPSAASTTAPAAGYLLCITESNAKGWGTDEKVHVGVLAVQPATGDIVYDDFEDGFMRSEIETRLLHIAPCEILIVGSLSKATEKLVQHLSGNKTNVFGDKIRVERVEKPKTMVAQAYNHVSNFYAGKMSASTLENDETASKLLENVLKLAEDVTVCLSAMITHMSDYGLEHVFDLTKYFQSFSARSHMMLNGNTLTSLEIYQNQTDHSGKGSLFWTLDRTKTRFGRRLLRKWVGRPLLIKAELEERISAVEELKNEERSMKVDKIKHLLAQIRTDLEKSLIRIYYGKVVRDWGVLTQLIVSSALVPSYWLYCRPCRKSRPSFSASNRPRTRGFSHLPSTRLYLPCL
jgi:DNA mismatch repair protein MSH3